MWTGIAGLPTTGEFFFILMVIWGTIMAIFVYFYLRGLGWNPGPITRKAEYEEDIEKRIVLEKHGKTPNEGNRKYKWFGWFSWIEDDVKPDDWEEMDG